MLSNYRRKRLDALIEHYASCVASCHWLDDQGTRDQAEKAHVDMNNAKLALMVMLDKITKEEE